MIDRTTGNVLPTNFIRPNYPGRGAITPRVFLDEMYRNCNAIQLEVVAKSNVGCVFTF